MPKVKIEKIIKVNREKIFNLVTDFENLPQRFPQFFKSVKVISRERNTVTTEDLAAMLKAPKSVFNLYLTENKQSNV